MQSLPAPPEGLWRLRAGWLHGPTLTLVWYGDWKAVLILYQGKLSA
jgi:hypothetical protein